MPLRRNRFAAWLALFALALQLFVPLAAQARPSSDLFAGTICSIGSVPAAQLPGIPLPDHGAGKTVKHCPLCSSGVDRAQAAVGSATPVLFVPSGAVDAPSARPVVSFRSLVVSPAHPRAPPVQS